MKYLYTFFLLVIIVLIYSICLNTDNNYFHLANPVRAQYEDGYTGSYQGSYQSSYSLSGTTYLDRNQSQTFNATDTSIPYQPIELYKSPFLTGPNGLSLNGHQGSSEFSNGDIAEVIIYNRSLTDYERGSVETYLNAKWALGISYPQLNLASGLLSYWKFNENTGTAVSDTRGANSGILSSNTAWIDPGKISSGIKFNGTNTHVDLGGNTSLKQLSRSAFTAGAWISNTQSTGTTGAIIGNLGSNTGWRLSVSDNKLVALLYISDSTYQRTNSNITLTPGWHYVTLTWDGTAGGKVKIYVDGQTNDTEQNQGSVGAGPGSNSNTYIGVAPDSLSLRFKGSIDEVALWTRVLSANEITALYNDGQGQAVDSAPSTPTPTSPSNIQGLALWLDASNPASVNTSPVNPWADLSENHRDFSWPAPGGRPSLIPNALNGKPVVRFSASPATTLTNSTNFGPPNTIIYLSRQTGGANGRLLSGLNSNWLLGYYEGLREVAYFDVGWTKYPGPASNTAWSIFTSVQTGPKSSLYNNGNPLGSFTSPLASSAITNQNGSYSFPSLAIDNYLVKHTLRASGNYTRINPPVDIAYKYLDSNQNQSFGVYGPFFRQSSPLSLCSTDGANLTLTWTSAPGAARYQILYTDSNGNSNVSSSNKIYTTGTTYTFTPSNPSPALVPTTSYSFIIVAQDSSGIPLSYSDNQLWTHEIFGAYTQYPECTSSTNLPTVSISLNGQQSGTVAQVAVDQNNNPTLTWQVTNTPQNSCSALVTSRDNAAIPAGVTAVWNGVIGPPSSAPASGGPISIPTSTAGSFIFNLDCTNPQGTRRASIELNVLPYPRPFFKTTGGGIHTNETIRLTP